MRKLFILFTLLAAVGSMTLWAQDAEAESAQGPILEADHSIHDFGKIPHKGNGTTEFVVYNRGGSPLTIQNARGTCGCTVPQWSREPIAPGDSTVITVRYDTNRIGPFTKGVILTSNAENTPTKQLTIKGIVEVPKPQVSEPTGDSPEGR